MKHIEFFEQEIPETPITKLNLSVEDNEIYIKRDDMIPFSFGGNKARKAAEFYREIVDTDTDVVMTYGSNSSNHCRIIANMAAAMGLKCHIISPEENRTILYNTKLVEQFGAVIEACPVNQVSDTIERRMDAFRKEGYHPYFIKGGGHGNPGTCAYVKAYQEIRRYEREQGRRFSYIFHASGTGTTQAGLVCGKLLERKNFVKEQPQIVGISIARTQERGQQVVKESMEEYLGKDFSDLYSNEDLIFTDKYRCGGYGEYNPEIVNTIQMVMQNEGIPMDTTYVGKAFTGMLSYLKEHSIKGQNILFLHTGGTPLFFDCL